MRNDLHILLDTTNSLLTIANTLSDKSTPESVAAAFIRNPVFMEGLDKDPNERTEVYEVDRYLHFLNQLSRIQQSLLTVKEALMRMGVHHITVLEDKHGQEKTPTPQSQPSSHRNPAPISSPSPDPPLRQQIRKYIPQPLEEDDYNPIGDSTSISPDS